MSLTQLVDQIDTLVTNDKAVSDIKAALIRLRDQIDALERENAELKQAHSAIVNQGHPAPMEWPDGTPRQIDTMTD
jgi:hypothetical protein